MARLEANLELKTGQDRDYICQLTKEYKDILTVQQIVDNNDEFTQIAAFGTALSAELGARMPGAKLTVVKNISDIPLELLLTVNDWYDN